MQEMLADHIVVQEILADYVVMQEILADYVVGQEILADYVLPNSFGVGSFLGGVDDGVFVVWGKGCGRVDVGVIVLDELYLHHKSICSVSLLACKQYISRTVRAKD
uniref:Uncharacterized protein n=1 Tax=Cacopsylla melanoneura TaxID=428564 RepID=A0A8D9EIK1_9HEMI